jgi:hypothetical protein
MQQLRAITENQSGEHQEIPGPQENADPLSQAPITSLKVDPPNKASAAPPVEKDNITGTSQERSLQYITMHISL